MFFNKKLEFTIYTDDATIKRNPLYLKNKPYYFNDNGIIKIMLAPKTYTFISCKQEIIYNFSDNTRVYYIYREDNDCHFNILIKDIDKIK